MTPTRPASVAKDVGRFRDALVAALGIPFFEGNDVSVLRNGVQIFPAMLDAIESARRSVDLLTYIYWQGDVAERFAHALAAAARRGVAVRLLLDGLGSMAMDRALVERMKQAGVDVLWFRPVSRWSMPWRMTQRTHRKVLVCDGCVGFTGGVGIGEEWEGDAEGPGSWRETHFRIRGSAVGGLSAAFVEDWLEASDAPVEQPPSAPTSVEGDLPIQVVRSTGGLDWSDRATLLWTLIATARSSIRISTPYFVPAPNVARQLAASARSGVDVSILLPGPYIDYRVSKVSAEAVYEELLDAGVAIAEYQRTMIHQKVAVFDRCAVSLGTANLNQRSRLQDHEVQLAVVDPDFADQIERMLDEDFALGSPVRAGDWKRRGPIQRLSESLMWPFRRHM